MATNSATKAHVLALPYVGLVGHVNPLMALCKQLAAEGVEVTFAYSQAYYDRSQAALSRSPQQAAAGYEGSHGIHIVGVRDGLAYQEYLSPDSPRLFCQAAIDMEDELVELARRTSRDRTPFTCVLADVFNVCASSVAQRLGIPFVPFWTQSAASFASHIIATNDYATLKGNMKIEDSNGGGEISLIDIPGCPPLKHNELSTFLQSLDPEEYFFSYLTRCFLNVKGCPHILINTFDALETESMHFLNKKLNNNVSAIGPLLPKEYMIAREEASDNGLDYKGGTSYWAADEKCLSWLDIQKPKSVLFVSFGSLALLSQAQIEELAYGLETSGHPFLIVVREALMDGDSALFPGDFQHRTINSGQALFVSWAPQLQVLAHSSIGAFLTHCGWNSTLEGISKGLPFLCWPSFVDQLMNCKCIVHAWKIGIEFEDDRKSSTPGTMVPLIGRDLFKEKVRYLMDAFSSVSIREKCEKLQLVASRAVLDDHGSSRLKLKAFMSWLHKVA